MSLIPVGKNRTMQRQEVRATYSTDLSPLLKLALAPMPPKPPHQTTTEELGSNDAKSPQQVEQADQQSSGGQQPMPNAGGGGQPQGQPPQQGVGGSFQRPGAMPQQVDPQQQEKEQADLRKEQYRKILELEDQLVKQLKQKKLRTKITVKTSPKQLLVTFSTTHKILDEITGEAVPAEDALKKIRNWWKVDIGGDATYDFGGGSDTGRDIERIDPSERVNFSFAYVPSMDKKNEKDQITTMNGNDDQQNAGGPDMGGGQDEEHVETIGGEGGEDSGPMKIGPQRSKMGQLPPRQMAARTLPEMLSLRKDALVKSLSKYIVAGEYK